MAPDLPRRNRLLLKTPLLLTLLRALLAPVVAALAMHGPHPAAFGLCLTLAFFSDIFDGVIARRLQVATPGLRRLDSAVDTLFYTAVTFAAWHLYPEAIRAHFPALLTLAALELTRYAFDFAKFGREASYHMWSSKLWGISLFAAFFALLALRQTGAWLAVPVYLGIIADLEGLAISCVLRKWRSDVPSLFHALRWREPDPT
ncbi:CDP-alcohol phosphatidyltransferase family protein [Luteolibacter soli]|uniref:CDP-alcohol phosphatidyltransferase family protein n=1 Tax=Luteolibacter soli TaxID=3135280 RepID=A0ABU9AU86_9BACT